MSPSERAQRAIDRYQIEGGRNGDVVVTDEGARMIADALLRISYGDVSGPTGLEGLAMAIAGEGPFGHDSLKHAVRELTEQFERIATALETIADRGTDALEP